MTKLRIDAADQPDSYGFEGDPNKPHTSKSPRNPRTLYYGYLVYAGGYQFERRAT